MLNTHGYVSLGPYLCITVVVPANNDFRRKKLPEIVATMNHCRSAPLRRSQQSTTLTRHRKWPIENRSCAGLWTITKTWPGKTFNGQLISEVVTFQVEYYYKLKGTFIKSIKMSFSKVSDNNYYLHRPGFNPSSRATYTIFHPSTNNFYTTMSVGRALLLNPGIIDFK